MIPTISLIGGSGRTYAFQRCNPLMPYNDVGGCYAFAIEHRGIAGVTSATRILYIGQTDSLKRRMAEHQNDQWARAMRLGANLILARATPNATARLAEEIDLIHFYQPRLNSHHVGQAASSLLGLAGTWPLNPLTGR